MYATDYFEREILNTLNGITAVAPPELYLALYLSNPTETGQAGTEVVYSGYARQPIVFSAPAPASGGIGVQNTQDITFPIAPTSVGTVTHLGVLDSLTGGNMLLYGEFTEPMSIGVNEAPVIIAGEAQWWSTGNLSNAYKTRALNLLRGTNMAGIQPYVSLYNGSPDAGGSELSGENYQRMEVTFSTPEEQVGGQMQISNTQQVNSPRSSTPWGNWSHTALFDAATAGTPVAYVSRAAKDVRKGLMVTIMPGALTVSIH